MKLTLLLMAALTLTVLVMVNESQSARILSISFFSSPSHKIVYEPLLHKLAERGHEVTVVSPIKAKKEVKNVKNIHTIDLHAIEKEMGFPNLFEMRESALMNAVGGLFNVFLLMGSFMDKICRHSYELPIVQDIISGKLQFDFIIFTPLFNDCLYGLVGHLNRTTVLVSQISIMPWMSSSLGNPTPPSFVPFPFFGFGDKMTFGERLINFVGIGYNELAKSLYFNPLMEKVYRDMVDPNLPGIKEIEANTSLVLCNSHISFTPPKPLMPDIIDVGGMHLTPAKPVPKDLEDFISGAGEHGFILFSMGSALKGSTMPEKFRQIFLNTFAKLKQRVIWKWETEEMEGLPKNVKLSKWLPQQDVLGHKNIKLFITHGGHGSTTESIYHGVPLVGIPMFGDQQYNMKRALELGFALPLEFTELSEEVLTNAINKVLNEPSYRDTVKRLSAIYKDQIDHPLDRAVYHVEYVMRHGGARHLRSAARDLSAFQYYSLDVIGTLLVVALLSAYVNFLVLRTLYRKCFGGKIAKSVQEANKKKSKNAAKKFQ